MESGFLTYILVSSFVVDSSQFGVTDWDDVVVAKEGMPTTLDCTDRTVRGAVAINWKVKPLDAGEWELALLATETEVFSARSSRGSIRLTDPNFRSTGNFSVTLSPKMEHGGLYSCLIKQQERDVGKRTILLAVLRVTVYPAPPILQYSTLELTAIVNPITAVNRITWMTPDGISMKSEKRPNVGTLVKLPLVKNTDSGVYVCVVLPWGNSSRPLFAFGVNVVVDADKNASFTNVIHGPTISTATQAQKPFPLTCSSKQGDYVRLYWQPPDTKRRETKKFVHQYNRWNGSTRLTEQRKKLQLAGPPYNAEAGSFSYLLTPGLKDGGLYICDVFLDDYAFSQRTLLSVLEVKTRRSSSKLELSCRYSERSQVQSAKWKNEGGSHQLSMSSSSPGHITTTVPLPITPDTAGNYTCTLQLKNGQTIWATQAVTLPPEESVSVTTPSPLPAPPLPSLSALLLLVPLVAAAVGVLLWKQKRISDRGIEQTLSVHSGEAENIYENPEDIKQAALQGSVYMDLKPRGDDDVYKELERSEQCQC